MLAVLRLGFMQAKTYVLLERAVEEGVARGWNRAHKHTDKPDEGQLRDGIADAVMAAICEVFSFSQEEVQG